MQMHGKHSKSTAKFTCTLPAIKEVIILGGVDFIPWELNLQSEDLQPRGLVQTPFVVNSRSLPPGVAFF